MSDDCVVFSLCLAGAISNASALFTYDSEGLLDTYYHAQRHDTSFLPVFSVPEDPNDPLANSASTICAGEGSGFCRCGWKTFSIFSIFFFLCFWSLLFVILQVWCLGGTQPSVGQCHQIDFPESHVSHAGPENRQVTLLSWEYVIACNHKIFLWSLPCCLLMPRYAVVSCGSLSPPDNGKKVGTWYLEGDRVRFSCNNGYQLQGSSVRVCLSSGQWSGEEAKCVVPSMNKS